MENTTQSQPSEVAKVPLKKHKKQRGFDIYIQKVLKQVHPDTRISSKAAHQMNALLELLGMKIAESAHFFVSQVGHQTLTSREIQSAVKLLIVGNLGKHAVSEGVKGVTKWNAQGDAKSNVKKERSECRAGLTFPVSRCRKLILLKGTSGCRIGKGAPIYLAAVLEYICAEILELSGNAARDNKKITISTRHIFLTISNDQELFDLFKSLNVDLDKGGSIQRISEKLLPGTITDEEGKLVKPKIRRSGVKSKKVTKDGSKSHRFRPGTVALREIRKQQKSVDLSFRKKPFDRIVREIFKTKELGTKDTRFSENVILVLQGFVETILVHIYQDSNDLALYCDRQGVSKKDINYSLWHSSFLGNCKVELEKTRDSKNQISDAAFVRLARRAGIKRCREDVYEFSRQIVDSLLLIVLTRAALIKDHKRCKTINLSILQSAIACTGFNYIF